MLNTINSQQTNKQKKKKNRLHTILITKDQLI